MYRHGGLHFRRGGDGEVIVDVGHNATENCDILRQVVFTSDQWRELLPEVMNIIVFDNSGTGLPIVENPDAPVIEVPPAQPEGEGSSVDLTPGEIATVPSDLAIDLIKKVTTVEELDKLKVDEEKSQKHPTGRKGVLGAIEDRRKELLG